MHESWKTATREVLLEALEWQSALTKEYSAKYDKVCVENARWISFAQDIGITLGCEYGSTPQENRHLWEQIVALRDNRLDEAVKTGVCEVCKEKSILECDRLRAELEAKYKEISQLKSTFVAITDTETDLLWEIRNQEDKMWWHEAMKRPEKLNAEKYAGFDDWRVPTIDELKGFMKSGVSPKKNWYWSSSFHSPGYAWAADFGGNTVLSTDKSSSLCVCCVRG